VIDDFEDYSDTQPDRVFDKWFDGTIKSKYGGSQVGYWLLEADLLAGAHFLEDSIVNGGEWSMPYLFNGFSEARLTMLPELRNWTQEDVAALSLSYVGYPAGVGSWTENPAGTHTLTAASGDIWGTEDEFYFVYKRLQGSGSITARLDSFGRATNDWAKAGVMIRETLDADSINAMTHMSYNGDRARMQYRGVTGEDTYSSGDVTGTTVSPHWIKIEKTIGNEVMAWHANDVGGSAGTWTVMDTQMAPIATDAYIGLALSSYASGQATAVFSNISTTGGVTGAWIGADISPQLNSPQPMYVTLQDGQGRTATVNNPDPDAANVTSWTELGEHGQGIALSDFVADNPSFNLADVNSILIGFGTQSAGSGLMFFDDIRLYKPKCVAGLAKPTGDFNNDCVNDIRDLEVLTDNWLISNWEVTPTAPSTSDLVAHYQFQGNVQDSSGNGYHGTVTGEPTYVAGQIGQALNVRGSSSVTAGNIGITGADPRTIAGWAKANVSANSIQAWTNVFGLSGASASHRHFDIQALGNATMGTYGYYGIHLYSAEDNLIPIDQDWRHLAATYDGTTIRGYADGQMTGSFVQPLNTEGVLQIGKRADNANQFNGAVDDVRVYSKALSQGEIASLAGLTAPFNQDIGLLTTTLDSDLDINADGLVDFLDYAIAADAFLDEVDWP